MPTLTLHRFTPADIASVERLLKQTHIDLVLNPAAFRQRCWLAKTASHELVGLSHVALTDTPTLVNGWLQHAVHPTWWERGLSERLIAKNWADLPRLAQIDVAPNRTQTELAQVDFDQNMAQAEPVEADFDPLNRRPKPLRLHAWTSHETPPEYEAVLRKLGLSPYHVYHEMSRSLEPLPPRSPSAANVVIKPWRDEHCAAAAQLRNQAFAQSWGYQPTSTAALERRFREGRYPAELSYTAWQGERMVGLVHGCWLAERSQAELVWIAVAPPCRTQGVGRLLMVTFMERVRQTGGARVTLSNDSAADKLEIDFFETLGFEISQKVTDYQATFESIRNQKSLQQSFEL